MQLENRSLRASLPTAFCWMLLIAASCDGIVYVEGSFISASGQRVTEECWAELYRTADHELLLRRPFGPEEHRISFTVFPVEGEYQIKVDCPGYKPFESPPFQIGGNRGFTYDLGKVSLEPRSLPE